MARTSLVVKVSAVLSGLYVAACLCVLVDWRWFEQLTATVYWWTLLPSIPLGLLWILWARWPKRRSAVAVCMVGTGVYILWWQLAVFVTDWLAWDIARSTLARHGTVGLFLVGLGWVVWIVERASQRYQARRRARRLQTRPAGAWESPLCDLPTTEEKTKRPWNPLDPDAWYYGRKSKRLNQSIAALMSYSVTFGVAVLLLSQLRGCEEIYEMPAGGGRQKTLAQTIRVKKVIRTKYVVNPYSAILFEVPPIDEVKLQLTEATEHAYTVGYGSGEGAGFGGGTARGKIRLIRLEYDGGDWDQGFGIGGDLNMLVEYGIRTNHKAAEKTESRTVAALRNFPVGKSPPMVYITGQKNISLSNFEVKVLREYLVIKHGMIFGDNGGSRHFHGQFLNMMNQVLPDVRPVPIPLDDIIHRVPYKIPFLPYVAPHGGTDALGWWKDGRWLCYYHPGDIGDAWADEHAGVKPEIWEACYQLGTNVIFYAHTEYSKWLEAQKEGR